MKAASWTAALIAAVLWPSRFIGPLDGAPLDAPLDAIVIGLAIPSLWWLCRHAVGLGWARWAMLALLGWKAITMPAAQQGLCVSMNAGRPLDGINQGIPIVEPTGALRSWDVRADWRSLAPRCTAIVTRPLGVRVTFPAWFLNVTSQLRGSQDVTMTASGFVTTSTTRALAVGTSAPETTVMRIDGDVVPQSVTLPAGTHAIEVSTTLAGETWRFEPTLDGQPLWSAALVTTTAPGTIDRLLGSWAWLVAPIVVAAIVAGLAAQALAAMQPGAVVLIGAGTLTAVAAAMGAAGPQNVQRMIGLVLLAAVAIPLGSRLRNLRGAFLVIGMPWLAFIAAFSLSQIGRFTLYSYDDWLTYQVAGHRIYFQGFWLEGGNEVFDFQPFYRWMTGALHLVFGDSSVGELYWDAACVMMGALLAFHVARSLAGFRPALAGAAMVIATMTLGTPWYFLGRGLSEIAAAGWAFLAMFFLLRGRRGSIGWALGAGALATLMFYTRLNHLLFAAFLPVFLLSCWTPAAWARVRAALARVRVTAALAFSATFAIGVSLFAMRTWYYTGVFSLFHGTSLKHNDTGLRPWTLLDAEVWSRIAHSLQATLFMNEPPRPDPRAVMVVAGAVVALLALAQTRLARRVPVIALVAAVGGTLGAFLAHAHGYPGRFTIHLIPFACALTVAIVSVRTRAHA